MWAAYIVYWWGMASKANTKEVERFEAAYSRIARTVLLITAALLLSLDHIRVPLLEKRFLPAAAWPFWVGAAITAAGLLFSVWARVHLGVNWSQEVTIKQDHQLVTSGPYGLVRHPIYMGLMTAFLGSAISRGEWRGLLAFALVVVALWPKFRLEEKWMRERFGESYETYSRRVAALVPHIF